MQKTLSLVFFVGVISLLCVVYVYRNAIMCNEVCWLEASQWLYRGELDKVRVWTDSVKRVSERHGQDWLKADSLAQIAQRIDLDYCIDEKSVQQHLQKAGRENETGGLPLWANDSLLEWRMVNGEKKFFKRAASNLKILNGIKESLFDSSLTGFCLQHTADVIEQRSKSNCNLLAPKSFEVTYTIAVDANVVPAGEVVRCWLPYPKGCHLRQAEVHLVSASEDSFVIAEDTCTHRSVYIEKPAVADKKTVFEVNYSYVSSAEYVVLDPVDIRPYNIDKDLYEVYTRQQAPHIVFSDRIKNLADSIVGRETNPYQVVRKLYRWIDQHIPWAGAPEYSIMSCIPEYVLGYKRGDCGMQTMLFMTMARYKGIPVKWQSGWMMHPGHVNLHDWCEVYYENIGWVPLDMSMGLQDSNCKQVKEFYITGIDAYRLIVNDGIGDQFYPSKKFLRSEPYDFQRGEVEWKEGNLYFNQWDYTMQISN